MAPKALYDRKLPRTIPQRQFCIHINKITDAFYAKYFRNLTKEDIRQTVGKHFTNCRNFDSNTKIGIVNWHKDNYFRDIPIIIQNKEKKLGKYELQDKIYPYVGGRARLDYPHMTYKLNIIDELLQKMTSAYKSEQTL